MNTQKVKQAAIGTLSISGGMIAGDVVSKKLLSKFLPASMQTETIKNAILVALGAAGYLFGDKIVGKNKDVQDFVQNLCLGMAAKGTSNIVTGVLPDSLKGTLGLGNASTPTLMRKIPATQALLPAPAGYQLPLKVAENQTVEFI